MKTMDCRTFHRNLEDYLEGGLDFSGRFGMERHALQCIRCGKELAGAQKLSHMALELRRVKAPENFEASVLDKIARRKTRSGFSWIRRFLIYGIEWPSWQKLAVAASSVAIIGIAAIPLYHRMVPGPGPVPSVASSRTAPAETPKSAVTEPVQNTIEPAETKEIARVSASLETPRPLKRAHMPDLESTETEYLEYQVTGPDNRPVTIRLPKRIRMQYGQASEEYFIRNVSH